MSRTSLVVSQLRQFRHQWKEFHSFLTKNCFRGLIVNENVLQSVWSTESKYMVFPRIQNFFKGVHVIGIVSDVILTQKFECPGPTILEVDLHAYPEKRISIGLPSPKINLMQLPKMEKSFLMGLVT